MTDRKRVRCVAGAMGRRILGCTALSAGLLLTSCGKESHRRGELMLVVSTDMNIDKDLERVDVIVERADGHVYNQAIDLYPQAGGLFTPGTFAIVEGDVEAEDVKVSLVARHNSEARVVRELSTKIPRERIGLVQLPVHWLCSGQVSTLGTHSSCY